MLGLSTWVRADTELVIPVMIFQSEKLKYFNERSNMKPAGGVKLLYFHIKQEHPFVVVS